MKEIVPLGNRIVAKPIQIEHKSEAGIITAPTSSNKTSNTAEVVFVGPNCTQVKPGDKIIYINNMTFEFKGDKYITCFEHEILGTLV